MSRKVSRAASGTAQKRMARAADQRMLDVCRTFNDIQSGSNPLTQAEIDRLVAKRPTVYGVLRACKIR